jgi:hypothetical protein
MSHYWRDHRSVEEQVKSGLKIAGALVATFAALILIASSCVQIINADGTHNVARGWLLMLALVAVLAATVQYWSRWFFCVPAYVAMRSLGWILLGWFSPVGYIFVCFPLLVLAMAKLSFRYSKLKRIRIIDRVILMIALACLLGSFAGFFAQPPRLSAMAYTSVADLVLWMASIADNQRKRQRTNNRIAPDSIVPTSDR